jgi:serine/threonine protein kinase
LLPVYRNKTRVHFKTVVGHGTIFFDLRHPGDDYYCWEWERHLLKSRVKDDKNIYVLNDEDRFYTLVYHALIHKMNIARDYHEKTSALFAKLAPQQKISIQDYEHPFDCYFALLQKFMRENGYYFCRPCDRSVFYNEALVRSGAIVNYLEEKYEMEGVRHSLLASRGGSGYVYFAGHCQGRKLFIKWGGLGESARNEFNVTDELHRSNPSNFIKPWFFRVDGDEKFVAFDFIRGRTLKDLMESGALTSNLREGVIRELRNIASTLLSERVTHRDIRPANLIVTDEGRVYLIDMQFALRAGASREDMFCGQNPTMLAKLGGKFALGKYKWNDMHSLARVLEAVGPSGLPDGAYDDVHHFISSRIPGMTTSVPRWQRASVVEALRKIRVGMFQISFWRRNLKRAVLILRR